MNWKEFLKAMLTTPVVVCICLHDVAFQDKLPLNPDGSPHKLPTWRLILRSFRWIATVTLSGETGVTYLTQLLVITFHSLCCCHHCCAGRFAEWAQGKTTANLGNFWSILPKPLHAYCCRYLYHLHTVGDHGKFVSFEGKDTITTLQEIPCRYHAGPAALIAIKHLVPTAAAGLVPTLHTRLKTLDYFNTNMLEVIVQVVIPVAMIPPCFGIRRKVCLCHLWNHDNRYALPADAYYCHGNTW